MVFHNLTQTTASAVILNKKNIRQNFLRKEENMKVVCQGLELSDAVIKVTKAINGKSVSPILDGIKLTAKDDCLTLFATDLELAIEKKINAEVLVEGETVVPGKFFGELVKMLTNEQIELTLDENQKLKIKYTDGEVEKKCFSVEELSLIHI